MGEVIQFRIEMTHEEFLASWKEQYEEWERIKDEWLEKTEKGQWNTPTVADITKEQETRRLREGRSRVLDMPRVWITDLICARCRTLRDRHESQIHLFEPAGGWVIDRSRVLPP